MGNCCIDYDLADVSVETWQRARKTYRCCECHHEIAIGQEYQKIKQLFDGSWDVYKTCEPCADLRESLSEVDCPLLEGLAECFQNWLSDGPKTVMSVKPNTHAARLVPSWYFQEQEQE